MSDNDPFTLDMFGNSQNALSSGLGLGVTAFAENPKAEPEETEPAPVANSSGSPAREESAKRPAAEAPERGSNFHLSRSRALAKGWKARARDNLEAIALAAAIAAEDRPATVQEQARLVRFTGFGASDLANTIFTRPGEEGFRKGWEDLGEELQASVNEADYASLAARNMLISPRSSSSGRCGRVSNGSAGAAAACLNRASAPGCFPP